MPSPSDWPTHWLNPPPHAETGADGTLTVRSAAPTDFWQKTHYGFEADSGHFLHAAVAGDFVMTVHLRFRARHQYDQAGLMVRLSPACWIKTSVEHEPDGPNRLGAVVTNHGFSDWSTQDVPLSLDALWLRLRREAADYLVEWRADESQRWTQLRLARLLEDDGARAVPAGIYCCSPKAAGFEVVFDRYALRPGRAS